MPRYVIGIDEAGYGPNLGPLTIGGCLWRVPADKPSLDALLVQSVRRGGVADGRLLIGDSKQLYQPQSGLGPLETNLLPLMITDQDSPSMPWEWLLQFLRSADFPPLNDLMEQTQLFADPDPIAVDPGTLSGAFFLRDATIHLPTQAAWPTILELRQRFLTDCHRQGVALQRIAGLALMPHEYNLLTEAYQNKALVLSTASLLLVRALVGEVESGSSLEVCCDKHGGRNRYRGLLERIFSNSQVETRQESAECSEYALEWSSHSIVVRFSAKGESALPTALASMFAKYFREIVMLGWNRFWAEEVTGIAPTKGYPVDAARFLAEIQPHFGRLKVSPSAVWRSR